MARTTAEGRAEAARTPGAAAAQAARAPGAGAAEPPLAATVALTSALALGAAALTLAVVLLVDHPTVLPPPFPPENQDAESLVFLLSFLVLLPGSLLAVPRLARVVAARAGAAGLSALAAALIAGLAIALLAVRLSGAVGTGDGVAALLVAMALWWGAAGAALLRATRPWTALAAAGRHAARAWAVAAALVLGALLCLTALRSITPGALAAGAVIAALAAAAGQRVPLLRRPWAIAAEVAIVAVLLLIVPDLVIFRPEAAHGNAAISIETAIIRFHQDFLLGPANQVLGGHAMLVDSVSQYGVGSIYLLAGWFLIAPIGYGTLGLLDGILTALWFAAGYGVLRLAGVSRTLAATALGVGVVVLVFALAYPVGALPQYGPLRFGMPMAVLLAAVAGARRPRWRSHAHGVALVLAGISAIFSLEAFAYTAVVYVALLCAEARLRERPGRLRWLAGRLGLLMGAWICAHVLFAGATLAATGHLPDWGQYVTYLRAFLGGNSADVGEVTYDVPPWSPGLAIGAGYVASATALLELARRGNGLLRREPVALLALTGLTAYGIAILSYWVNRSQGHILEHVALPALLAGALWLSLAARSGAAARRIALGFGLAVAVLLVSVAWSSVGDRFPRSALAHAAPGGESLRGALQRLWHPPALNRAALAGQSLLERRMPGERSSVVIAAPDLAVEILVRSGRTDALGLGDAWEASYVARSRLPALRRAVAALRPGRRLLLDAAAVRALGTLHSQPGLDPLKHPVPSLASLQGWALWRISQRFRLRTLADEDGFSVVRLTRRAP